LIVTRNNNYFAAAIGFSWTKFAECFWQNLQQLLIKIVPLTRPRMSRPRSCPALNQVISKLKEAVHTNGHLPQDNDGGLPAQVSFIDSNNKSSSCACPTSMSQAGYMGSARTAVDAQYVVHFTIFALLPMLDDVYITPSSSIYQQPVPTMTTYQPLSGVGID